jgi:hypothetical protein
MDPQKREKLGSIGYRIAPACGLCKHMGERQTDLGLAKAYWSICDLHSYEHEKHEPGHRQLGVNAFGSCKDFEADAEKVFRLQVLSYGEFCAFTWVVEKAT